MSYGTGPPFLAVNQEWARVITSVRVIGASTAAMLRFTVTSPCGLTASFAGDADAPVAPNAETSSTLIAAPILARNFTFTISSSDLLAEKLREACSKEPENVFSGCLKVFHGGYGLPTWLVRLAAAVLAEDRQRLRPR